MHGGRLTRFLLRKILDIANNPLPDSIASGKG